MKAARDNGMVHGVDCKRLGSLFASEVIKRAQARIADLPALQRHSVYNTLPEENKSAVRRNIRNVAHGMLTIAGYAPETVARVLDGK